MTAVFDGYEEWASYYSAQPDWVLTNLAQALADAGQQAALLQHLHDIADALPEARTECLTSFKNDIDQWVPNWRYDANAAPAAAQTVQAYPNTDSWNYSHTPGTLYYKYLERDGEYVYVYNDHANAADQDWHELRHWDDMAETQARKPERIGLAVGGDTEVSFNTPNCPWTDEVTDLTGDPIFYITTANSPLEDTAWVQRGTRVRGQIVVAGENLGSTPLPLASGETIEVYDKQEPDQGFYELTFVQE